LQAWFLTIVLQIGLTIYTIEMPIFISRMLYLKSHVMMTRSIILNRYSILKKYNGLSSSKLALAAVEAAISGVEPVKLMSKAVSWDEGKLIVSGIGNKTLSYDMTKYNRLYIVGAGKASVPMAEGLIRVLHEQKSNSPHISGLIITPYGTSKKIHDIDVVEAGHPLPDRNGVKATGRIVQTLRRVTTCDLVFVLLSGGGSALMSLPLRGVTLADKRYITQSLLHGGATIQDLNVVRKHLSKVKGGKLIQFSPPSTTFLTLLISDVIGDEIQSIASGPTFPNCTTFVDAKRILLKYDIWNADNLHLKRIRQTITDGINLEGNDCQNTARFRSRSEYAIIGNNATACEAASRHLRSKKIDTIVLGSHFNGDATNHGEWLSLLANGMKSLSLPFAIVLGGETTVRLHKRGKNGTGGRNQEAALNALLSLDQSSGQDLSICCIGTDGIDGNSTAAGAMVTSTMANQNKLDKKEVLRKYLENHDSSTAFKRLGSLIITGKTLTNVNDINVICKVNKQ
jgi:glycerate 2-kinase